MRIGIIAHLKHPIAEPFAGGLEMHTHLLARSLKARGHEVTVFASALSDPSLTLEPVCEETSLHAVGTAEAGDVAFFKEHHAYLDLMTRLRRSRFDVIHNNSLHYLPVAMADTLPMPMVTVLHTPPFCWLESGVRTARPQRSAFVAVSAAVRQAWSPITPIDRIIRNGIDLARFAFRPTAAPEPYLAWTGRIVPEKGLELAIDAAQRLESVLEIAGPIADQAYFAEHIAPRLGERVRHRGHLDHPALAGLIGGARAVLCTPRWEEPYGLVLAEALACGTPVAAFARGAIPEILTPACGVLAPPDDAAALADAAARASRLDRAACRQRAERFCDAQAMVDQYESFYHAMLEAPAEEPATRRLGAMLPREMMNLLNPAIAS